MCPWLGGSKGGPGAKASIWRWRTVVHRGGGKRVSRRRVERSGPANLHRIRLSMTPTAARTLYPLRRIVRVSLVGENVLYRDWT